MTQTPSPRKGQPVIRYFQDGPGWSYTITLDGAPILGAWCRGQRAVAERDAAYRLKQWQSQTTPAPITAPDPDDWLDSPAGRRWMVEQLDRLDPPLLSKMDEPDYWLG